MNGGFFLKHVFSYLKMHALIKKSLEWSYKWLFSINSTWIEWFFLCSKWNLRKKICNPLFSVVIKHTLEFAVWQFACSNPLICTNHGCFFVRAAGNRILSWEYIDTIHASEYAWWWCKSTAEIFQLSVSGRLPDILKSTFSHLR